MNTNKPSKGIEIRDVWKDNLEKEFALIREVVCKYKYISFDCEFPGVVARYIGNSNGNTMNSPSGGAATPPIPGSGGLVLGSNNNNNNGKENENAYQLIKCNVDLLKVIQLGLSFTNETGKVPDDYPCYCWQFHFKFSLQSDLFAQESIDLLIKSGLDFNRHQEMGIDPNDFGELLTSSGLVLCDDVHWIAFHSGYDFAYIIKLLTASPLPNTLPGFYELLREFFPNFYDIKHMMTKSSAVAADGKWRGGLNALASTLKVERIGQMHQAGSDSLLTSNVFFSMLNKYFANANAATAATSSSARPNDNPIVDSQVIKSCKGVIHGL